SPLETVLKVALQAAGGLGLGLAAALATAWAMRFVDDYLVEVSLSLALAMGVYAAAQALGLSGPISAVSAGLVVGASRGLPAMSETTRAHLTTFWTLIDEMLNAVLFFLMGLLLLIVPLQPHTAS